MGLSEEVLIDAYEVHRPKPENLSSEDHQNFESEWKRKFDQVHVYTIQNAWIDSGGIVSTRRHKIIPQSLVNLRKSSRDPRVVRSHFFRSILKRPLHSEDKFVWISERWSSGYFHWLCDALPRYYALLDRLDQHVVLLPAHYGDYTYIRESLDYLDISHAYIQRKTKISSPEILFSSLLSSPGNFYPPVIKQIRKEFAKRTQSRPNLGRVFISRQKARIRKIINMDECESILTEFDFKVIVMEEHSFSDQMDIVSSADVIMGMHGAGLTNMIACKESCSVIEIRGSQDKTNNCFFSLAAALDLDYYYVLAHENPTENDLVGNVDLDPIVLREFLCTYFPMQ